MKVLILVLSLLLVGCDGSAVITSSDTSKLKECLNAGMGVRVYYFTPADFAKDVECVPAGNPHD